MTLRTKLNLLFSGIVLVILGLALLVIVSQDETTDYRQQANRLGQAAWQDLVDRATRAGNFVPGGGLPPAVVTPGVTVTTLSAVLLGDGYYDVDANINYPLSRAGERPAWRVRMSRTAEDELEEAEICYRSLCGAVPAETEILGLVVAIDRDTVILEIKALRRSGHYTVLIQDARAVLVGREYLEREAARRISEYPPGVPARLDMVPAGLEPSTVARLFVYLAQVEHNRRLWDQLVSATVSRETADYWYDTRLADPHWRFFYLGPGRERDFNFQKTVNKRYSSFPTQVTVERENGEFKVTKVFF